MYPVYAGLAPSLVRELIETLPQVQKKELFVFNTKGIDLKEIRNTIFVIA